MYSKAKIFGHPIHPMIVAFPITFYTLTFLAFAVFQFFSSDPFWYRLAYFSNFAGVFTAIVAAVPGFIDWSLGIPKDSSAHSRGILHMALNVTALILFGINALRISGTWNAPPANLYPSLLLSLVGWILTSAAGYHGWELIARHKVGVQLTPEQEVAERKRDRREPSGFSRESPHPI